MTGPGREGIGPGGRPYRVIIADDDAGEAANLARVLEGVGFDEPVIVDNGRALVNRVRSDKEPADLIILDIIMPVLDGFAAFWELKQIPNAPPVVFLTVENSVAVVKYLLENGAADYITQPLNRPKFLERIGKVLGRTAKS